MKIIFPQPSIALALAFASGACAAEVAPASENAEPTAHSAEAYATFPAWGSFCSQTQGRCLRYQGVGQQMWGLAPSGDINMVFSYDGQNIHTWDGNCVDDQAFGLTGNPVQGWTCTNGANQHWSQDSNFEFHGWGGECLELTWNSGFLGLFGSISQLAEMQPCNGNDALEKLEGVIGGGTTGTVGFQGYYPASIGMTMDVQWNGRANGTPVWLWHNNGSSAQNWVWNSQTLTISLNDGSGVCLDKPWGLNDAGRGLQIWQCNGAVNEQWVKVSPNQFVNVQSGMCLDAAFANFNDGAPITMQPCNGGLQQQWDPLLVR